ncbi:alpha/beta fold hydrolase [Aliiglaciecola sp. CAU 1673]|uniref:alpha/beta fold hydrolase n=1 Tax=Aliiglaciecola sp. CAU 1673 TaxID=3032595 RepID=UPI0023DC2B61|nr:alpha/beta fold hydrolase [Aliiglaciecola sp. CAU 1673]MDF2179399.1 alpha/beta fold hydrolase [Aliiglaciecola sp. CAU 1673]
MYLVDKAKGEAKAKLLLAHGAGSGMHSDFMQQIAALIAAQGFDVYRFDFPYMQRAMQEGKRRPPDPMAKLEAAFMEAIAQLPKALSLFIGGKSMGGRVASMLLEQTQAKGAICLGYPFHPPGKPDKLRTEHLRKARKPMLIIQGERDTFGNQQEVGAYDLAPCIEVKFLADGDHSFKPRKASGFTQEQHMQQAALWAAAFMEKNR